MRGRLTPIPLDATTREERHCIMAHRTPSLTSHGFHGPASAAGRRSTGRRLALIAAVGFLSLLMGLIAGLAYDNPMLTGTILGLLPVLLLIWYRPVMGIYILIGGAVVFETFPLGFPDSFTDKVLFFQSFNSAGGPGFLIITAAEVLMGFTLAAVVLRRMAAGEKPLETGPLIWAVGIYTMMVGFGLIHGVGTGGNWLAALWETRAQMYLFMVYLIVVNTIKDRSQVNRILWIFLIGVAFKGVIGVWRWLVTLGGDTLSISDIATSTNSILSHEESYFFALFLILAAILYLFRSHRGQLVFALIGAVPVLLAMVANERRAGNLILIIGLLLVLWLGYRLLRYRRKAILSIVLVMVLLTPIYLGATWNSEGKIAEPTRAIRSLVQPNERDAGSNDFRQIEALNLKYNITIDPILGRGYGKQIIFFVPLPYIGDLFVWWDIIPHNTILWVWMRLGFLGFVAFWFLVGRTLVGAMMTTKQLSDPYLQGVGVFTIAALVTWVFLGAIDMGLVDFRVNILIGTLIGLVGLLAKMQPKEADDNSADAKPESRALVKPTATPKKV